MPKPQTIVTPITRGDDYSFLVSLSKLVYTAGGSLFFGVKLVVDNDLEDTTAVLKQELTDDDLDPLLETDEVVVYTLAIAATETTTLIPGNYHAELEWVSADHARVVTFPAPEIAQWIWAIGADVNRRIETAPPP